MSRLTAVCYNDGKVSKVVVLDRTIAQCIRDLPVDGMYHEFVSCVDAQDSIVDDDECENDAKLAAFCKRHGVLKVIVKHQSDEESYSIGELSCSLIKWIKCS